MNRVLLSQQFAAPVAHLAKPVHVVNTMRIEVVQPDDDIAKFLDRCGAPANTR